MLTNPRDAKNIRYIIGSDDARPSYFVFSIFKKAAVRHLGFSYFRNFYKKKSNLRLFIRRTAKFGEDRKMRDRVIAYFRFSKWRPSAILDLI